MTDEPRYHCEDCGDDETLRVMNGLVLCWVCRERRAKTKPVCRNWATGSEKERRLHRLRKVKPDTGLCHTCTIAARREVARTRRGKRVQKTYGMDTNQHNELFTLQGGRCPHGRPITLRSPVDHDHSNGLVRGLLCDPCNRFIGYVKDQPQALLNLWAYLLRPPAQVPREDGHSFRGARGLVQCLELVTAPGTMPAYCGRLEHEHGPAILPRTQESREAQQKELDALLSSLVHAHETGAAWASATTATRERLWQRAALYGLEPANPKWRDY